MIEYRHAFRYVRKRHPFTVDAIVILPDHLHTIWTMPDGDADFVTRRQLIKSTFLRGVPATGQVMLRLRMIEASTRDDEFRFAQPVLRAAL